MAEIKNYSIRMYGGPDGSVSGVRAQVLLFGNDDTMDGMINFYNLGAELPPSKSDLYIQLSMHVSELPAVVDMLRNESPVYLNWQENLKNGFIGTGQEPAGEGEIRF